MTRRAMTATLVAGFLLALVAGTASAHGGNSKFRSEFRSIQPAASGIRVDVLNYDDRLLMINRSGKTVAISGYEREPYARLRADGTVEVNRRSPTHYLNEERYGGTPVPQGADPKVPPQWQVISRTGRFEWHDHRIHFMSKSTPNQVKDKGKRTKIFDWRVPIVVGGRPVGLRGDLYWVPSPAGIPRAALLALAAFVFASIFFVEVVRRRRRQQPGRPRKTSEAWG